ncbi:MAG: hypothetical protein ACAH20_18250 [Methylobacteriaceae bacterium]
MARLPVDASLRATMRRLRTEGLSLREIAARVGRRNAVVFQHVWDIDIRHISKAGVPVTNREREAMRRLREQGMALEEIGAQVGRSIHCVHDHVSDIAVRCRPGTKGLGADGYARRLAAAEGGVPRAQLAVRFGLAVNSVGPILTRARQQRERAKADQEACAC